MAEAVEAVTEVAGAGTEVEVGAGTAAVAGTAEVAGMAAMAAIGTVMGASAWALGTAIPTLIGEPIHLTVTATRFTLILIHTGTRTLTAIRTFIRHTAIPNITAIRTA